MSQVYPSVLHPGPARSLRSSQAKFCDFRSQLSSRRNWGQCPFCSLAGSVILNGSDTDLINSL